MMTGGGCAVQLLLCCTAACCCYHCELHPGAALAHDISQLLTTAGQAYCHMVVVVLVLVLVLTHCLLLLLLLLMPQLLHTASLDPCRSCCGLVVGLLLLLLVVVVVLVLDHWLLLPLLLLTDEFRPSVSSRVSSNTFSGESCKQKANRATVRMASGAGSTQLPLPSSGAVSFRSDIRPTGQVTFDLVTSWPTDFVHATNSVGNVVLGQVTPSQWPYV
jgi:hypothetical protein